MYGGNPHKATQKVVWNLSNFGLDVLMKFSILEPEYEGESIHRSEGTCCPISGSPL